MKLTPENIFDLIGKTIQFNKNIELAEINYDTDMKTKVIDVQMSPEKDCFFLLTDFTEFEEHNKTLMKSNYYDANGVPCLKWSQVERLYPKNKQSRDWYDYTTPGFDILP